MYLILVITGGFFFFNLFDETGGGAPFKLSTWVQKCVPNSRQPPRHEVGAFANFPLERLVGHLELFDDLVSLLHQSRLFVFQLSFHVDQMPGGPLFSHAPLSRALNSTVVSFMTSKKSRILTSRIKP